MIGQKCIEWHESWRSKLFKRTLSGMSSDNLAGASGIRILAVPNNAVEVFTRSKAIVQYNGRDRLKHK